MKALLCKSLDGPASLVIEEVDEPVAGPGEAVIAVEAAALNFFDTLITRGRYQTKPALPFSPCGEVAGTVVAIGHGVQSVAVGQRVLAYLGYGGARERVNVDARLIVPIPDTVGADVACGIAITYGTALHGLRTRGGLLRGETVAVLGAAGGAGLAAVEVAKAMGARVIACASSEDKLAVCREHGADETVVPTVHDLKERLRDITAGKGVDVVYDCVGGDLAEPAFRALGWNGRFLVIGFASGEIPKLPLNLCLVKGSSAIGVFWGESVRRDPQGFRDDMAFALQAIGTGLLRPRVHARVPFTLFADGFGYLEQRTVSGKVVLTGW